VDADEQVLALADEQVLALADEQVLAVAVRIRDQKY